MLLLIKACRHRLHRKSKKSQRRSKVRIQLRETTDLAVVADLETMINLGRGSNLNTAGKIKHLRLKQINLMRITRKNNQYHPSRKRKNTRRQ